MEKKLPLFIVTGSSGSGKTYVTKELRRILPDFHVFDIDDFRVREAKKVIDILLNK